jgi:hypothetical protein
VRYPIQVPVTFSWSVRNGAMRQGKGRSRDVSEGGAFVFARNLPLAGASISLSIQFRGAGGRFLRMEVTGEVVRVELPLERKLHWGFAVASKTVALNGSRIGASCRRPFNNIPSSRSGEGLRSLLRSEFANRPN